MPAAPGFNMGVGGSVVSANGTVSYRRLLGRVFSLLNSPADGPNKAGDVYERLLGRLEHYRNLVQTFGGNYLVSPYSLTIQPGRTIYDIQDGLFAEPLLVEVVDTPTSPLHIGKRTIDIVDRQDLHRFAEMDLRSVDPLQQVYGNGTGVLLPRACAWWHEDGQQKLAFSSEPAQAIYLRILFEPASPFELAEADAVPFLPAFMDLLAAATALESVDLFEYPQMSERNYQRMIERLSTSVAKSEQVLTEYVANDHMEVAGPTESWGSRRNQQAFGGLNYFGGL